MLFGLFYCLVCAAVVTAQELSDTFGFDDESGDSNSFSIGIGGRLSLGDSLFFNDFKTFKDMRISSLIAGKLHIHAVAPLTEAYFGVRLNERTLAPALGEKLTVFPVQPQISPWIDEAFLKILLGQVVVSGGIRKLSWGRAEMLSVLDIINPRDKTDLTLLFDSQEMKIARPLLCMEAYLPYDMKLESVFLPVFEGNHIAAAKSARWYSSQFDSVLDVDYNIFNRPVYTDTLAYAQGGGRFTASVGGMHDFGVQYFYGRLPDLAFKAEVPAGSAPAPAVPKYIGIYNPYHHIGFDYGAGIGPIAFNAELAANITPDISGDDPSIYNPSFAWNIGAGYSAPFGFKLNVTAAETVRLYHKQIGRKPYDVENGLSATDTHIFLSLSQTLLRSSFEWKLGAIIGLEDADFCIAPGIHWQFATLILDCNVGIFGGKKSGKQGQFYRNNFIRLTAAYEF